jgi:tryptophanyl-tRNA synthetase
MAGYFNRAYGDVFPMPKEQHGEAAVVPGTDGRKMSKSYRNTIEIFAEGKALKTAVNAVATTPIELGTPIDPETDHIFALYALFSTAEEQADLAAQYRDPHRNAETRNGRPFGFGDAKQRLLGKIDAHFGAARQKRKELAAQPEIVEAVLQAGARKARAEAQKTLAAVRQRIGMLSQPV